jgi:hypothetical protein
MRFQYEVLTSVETPNGPDWMTSAGVRLGPNLPLALNQLGAQGWEVVLAADVTRSARVEIILKKTVP